VRLVTRDDAGDPARVDGALEEVVGEGASVIIAGLDGPSADRALRWGEAHGIPILVLAPPLQEKAGPHGFLLGESHGRERTTLLGALAARGATNIAVITSGGDPTAAPGGADTAKPGALTIRPPILCSSEAPQPGAPRFPVVQWGREKVRGVVVDGPHECARDALREIDAHLRGSIVALTLESASTAGRAASVTVLAEATGSIPAVGPVAELSNPDVRAYIERFGASPNWWTALGRDAAALARAAIRDLPDDTVTEAGPVADRRTAVLAKLSGSVKARLWTTEADGFDRDHVIPRTLRVIEFPRTR
jgi:hypothetical protein